MSVNPTLDTKQLKENCYTHLHCSNVPIQAILLFWLKRFPETSKGHRSLHSGHFIHTWLELDVFESAPPFKNQGWLFLLAARRPCTQYLVCAWSAIHPMVSASVLGPSPMCAGCWLLTCLLRTVHS